MGGRDSFDASAPSRIVKIKCTYATCYKHFDSEAAMIKHKKKDPEHAYCSKCNVDCDDDMQFMIHQMESNRHTCCPVCGMEFKSTGGRDRHVEINHASDQRLPCKGCKIVFTRASALMRHIELDECKVITLKDFQRERAERAIEKDAFAETLDKSGGSAIVGSGVGSTSHHSSEVDDGGGVSLLDSERPTLEQDWQGNVIQPRPAGSYRAPLPQSSGHSITALNKYPALPAKASKSVAQHQRGGDLLDIDAAEDKVSKLSLKSGVWGKTANHSKTLFPTQKQAFPKETDSQYDNLSEVPFDPNGSVVSSSVQDLPRSLFTPANRENIPPTGIPVNLDHNAENARIQSAQIITKQTGLDIGKYWNTIREAYECPGTNCGRIYPTPESFRDHLLSGAHVGGHVTCPSCLNRFRTNSAMISHMESGGKGCNIRNSTNYNHVLREVTAGLIGTSGHLEDGTVRYMAPVDEGWDVPEKKSIW